MVNGLNHIFKQAGIKFTKNPVIHTRNRDDWFELDYGKFNSDATYQAELRTLLPPCNGLKVYIVDKLVNSGGAAGAFVDPNYQNGKIYLMVIPSDLRPDLVGHEFGHGVGLRDIYVSATDVNGSNPSDYPDGYTNTDLSPDFFKKDWTEYYGGEGYFMFNHATIIRRLLMNGFPDLTPGAKQLDIPLDGVKGILRIDQTSTFINGWPKVSIDDINYNPESEGGIDEE